MRVVILGSSCSGKTTLARALSGALQIPHVELDALHWLPGWRERPREELRVLAAEATAGERWVVDGYYRSRVADLIWPRATHLVWLKLPLPLILSRWLRRTTRRVITRERLFSGNQESLREALLSRDALLWWILRTHRERAQTLNTLFLGESLPEARRVILTSPAEVRRWLREQRG